MSSLFVYFNKDVEGSQESKPQTWPSRPWVAESGSPLGGGVRTGVSDYDTESLSVNHSGQRVQRVPCSIVAATKD